MDQLPEFYRYCRDELKADNLNISFAKTGDHAQYALLHHDDLGSILLDKPARLQPYEDPQRIETVLGELLEGSKRGSCHVTLYPQMHSVRQIRDFLAQKGERIYRPCHLYRSIVVVLPDGTVIPCLSRRLGNVQDHDYRVTRLLRETPYQAFMETMQGRGRRDLPEACNVCCFARVR